MVFVLPLPAAAGSGVLHSVMSRTQSPPPKARLSAKIDPTDIKVSISEAYAKLSGLEEGVDAVSVRSVSVFRGISFSFTERKGRKMRSGLYIQQIIDNFHNSS